jgi:CHAT domain-containing protein/tetratricopeptide (TPR) repeat protein
MRLRALRPFLLPVLFAITPAPPPAFSQPRNDTELRAMKSRVEELYRASKYNEAIPLAERYAAAAAARYGENAHQYGTALNNLAQLLQDTNHLSEAEPLMRRALTISEKSLGPNHPNVAVGLNNLAQLLQDTNRLSEAEPLMRRALAIEEKSFGPDRPEVAIALDNLALILKNSNRSGEAEPLMRRALAIEEKSFGPDHPDVATALNNLAQLLKDTNRLSEAEPLFRRALAIWEKGFGPDHPKVATALDNLAVLLQATNRLSAAEPLMRRALAIEEKRFGPDHPKVALYLNNLAGLLQDTNRLSEAEPLYRRALAIDEKSFGSDHPEVAFRLGNLAGLLIATNRISEAEPLRRRELAILEKALPEGHPHIATALKNVAALSEDQGRWPEAVALFRKAKPIMTGARTSGESERGGLGKAVLAQNTVGLRLYARALYRAAASDAAGRAEGFEVAQWALQNDAADALSVMAARFAKGSRKLGKLVREEQDLLRTREAAYSSLDAAAGKADAKAAEAARTAITQIERRLAEKRSALREAFPDYAELANPKPLSLADAQKLLGEGDALVLFLGLGQAGRVPEETIVFALTKDEARWASIGLGLSALRERVTALRCGLDAGAWRGSGRRECRDLTGAEPGFDSYGEVIAETLPFDLARASALYHDLFGGIEDLIQGKRLLIVPSGALTQLPFEVLVTAKPDEALPRSEAYKKAAWLVQQQAITMLPSVGSLKSLRAARANAAGARFIGFGNPLLDGENGTDKRAWSKQSCRKPQTREKTQVAGRAEFGSVFRNGQLSLEDLRHQPPLPETAIELCSVAEALGVPEAGLDKAVYLGGRATVSQIKALSKTGELAKARIIHFATHGLIAGETAMFAKARAEPALVLTPPATASEDDNGLLTASEVAQLNLNAEWVVMSACNTAAGSSYGAEALSGLARAFFYAGARALLVSHWAVDSQAAVAITTGAMNELAANPKVGRAEALRRAEAALITSGGRNAHPSVWAPFVLVGNGGQ